MKMKIDGFEFLISIFTNTIFAIILTISVGYPVGKSSAEEING